MKAPYLLPLYLWMLVVLGCSSSDTDTENPTNELPSIQKEKTELQNQVSSLKQRITLLRSGTDVLPKDDNGQTQSLLTNLESINTTIQQLETNINGLTDEGQQQLEALKKQMSELETRLANLESLFTNLVQLFANDERLIRHENGVTIMLNPNLSDEEKKSLVGQRLRFELDRYTVVDEEMLRNMIEDKRDVELVITSLVTDMSEMFFDEATSFYQDIGNWDTSKVTDMSFMFYYATSFNQNLSEWNVNRVQRCSGFATKSKLSKKQLPPFTKCYPYHNLK